MELVEKASKFIRENASIVDPTYRSLFHMEPTVGWMNDPNGLIYADGEFHLFYQANPFEAKNVNMAWGHFVSQDLLHYKEVDCALYPEPKKKETGCFTGSCFIEDGKMKVVYTRHYDKEEGKFEEDQYICNTKDKLVYTKEAKPCIDPKELPDEIDKVEIRDPQIFYRDGVCYLIVGGHTVDQKGVFLIYSGKDSSSLHYSFYFGPYENTYSMVECPSMVKVNGKDVVIYSTYGMMRESNAYVMKHRVFYAFGEFLPKEKTFKVEGEGRIDNGDSFYAPKTIENYDTPIMIGWMENWRKVYKTAVFGHNWVGSFTIPRVLEIKDGLLYQHILPELFAYATKEERIHAGDKLDNHSLNSFSFEKDFSIKLSADNGRIKIYRKNGKICLDMLRANNLHENLCQSRFEYEKGEVTFLLDTSSIELFIDGGKETMTSRFYLHNGFKVEKRGVKGLVSRKIEVNCHE